MTRRFTLEYWTEDGWFIGKVREVPGVFSQGETIEELEANIRDAYRMMMETTDDETRAGTLTKEILLEVA